MILMRNATPELAIQILQRAQSPNQVQKRVVNQNLTARNAQWRRINHCDVLHFPILDINYLKDLTVGIYQIYLVPGYIQDKR